MRRSRAICVIGNANIDLVAGSITDWPAWGTEVFLSRSDFRIGGSAANTAIVLQRLGYDVGLVSAHGNDAVGKLVSDAFAGPLDRMAEREESTSVSVGILQAGGERSFFSTNGHLDRLDASFFRDGLDDWPLDGALALVSGGFALPALAEGHTGLLRWLKDRGAEIAIDPGWPGDNWSPPEIDLARDWMMASDHVLLNEMEAIGLSGAPTVETAAERLSSLLAPGARLVVKRGPEGASVWREGAAQHAPAASLDVVDTVGAGDAFNAGYLGAIADGATDLAALRNGIRVAGHVISEFPRRFDPISPVC